MKENNERKRGKKWWEKEIVKILEENKVSNVS